MHLKLKILTLFCALFLLGCGEDSAISGEKSLDQIRKEAEKGNTLSQFDLGLWYFQKGGKKNYKRALGWFEKSAQNGHAGGQLMAGKMYFYGTKDIKTKPDLAIKYLESAAQANNAEAQFIWGKIHLDGKTVLRNDDTALEWLELSVKNGFIPAEHALGILLLEGGRELVPDENRGVQLIKSAADKGYVASQIQMAVLYIEDRGVPRNLFQAKFWIEKAFKNQHISPVQKQKAQSVWDKNSLWRY